MVYPSDPLGQPIRMLAQPQMEHRSHADEERKNNDLQDQTTEHDVAAESCRPASSDDAGADGLGHEAHHIAADEDLRDPGGPQHRVSLAGCCANDTIQRHVYGRSKENGREKDAEHLHDLQGGGGGIGAAQGARDVASGFHGPADDEGNAGPSTVLEEAEGVGEREDGEDGSEDCCCCDGVARAKGVGHELRVGGAVFCVIYRYFDW